VAEDGLAEVAAEAVASVDLEEVALAVEVQEETGNHFQISNVK
jgi:hypothetical protein